MLLCCNGGSCVNNLGLFFCSCVLGWIGMVCEKGIIGIFVLILRFEIVFKIIFYYLFIKMLMNVVVYYVVIVGFVIIFLEVIFVIVVMVLWMIIVI